MKFHWYFIFFAFYFSILNLQQKTMLEKYKNEWWKERECESNVNANKGLDIKRLAGTFIVIGIGLGFGLLFLVLELIWNKYYFKVKRSSPTVWINFIIWLLNKLLECINDISFFTDLYLFYVHIVTESIMSASRVWMEDIQPTTKVVAKKRKIV